MTTTGMSLIELVHLINANRGRAGLGEVEIKTRPSNSAPGKTTIEVWTGRGESLLCKSTHGGAINWFLKGMVAGFMDGPLPKINISRFENVGSFERRIDWKD